MAHTLSATYATDAVSVTLDFIAGNSGAAGFALEAYEMGMPAVETAYNSSLYSDNRRMVYSKRGSVVDTITITVQGSTAANLYARIHQLSAFGEYCRTYAVNQPMYGTPYLKLKPDGATDDVYALVSDCRIELPPDWMNTATATYRVEGVVLTLERSLWYRDIWGTTSTVLAASNAALASSATNSTAVAGDVPAAYVVTFGYPSSGATINRLIIGYRSALVGGTYYNTLGIREAESQTNGTDTSDAADATASAGNKVACTFGTTGIATRLSGTNVPHGVHRVFARMKITGDIVATANVKYADTNATGVVYVANTAVTVSSTSWLVYDMGVVRIMQSSAQLPIAGSISGVYAIDALRASGTSGNLDIDWIYFMPTEGYLTASSFTINTTTAAFQFNSTLPPNYYATLMEGIDPIQLAPVTYTASLDVKPGTFALCWLAGTDSGGVFDVDPAYTASVGLNVATRFITPDVVTPAP